MTDDKRLKDLASQKLMLEKFLIGSVGSSGSSYCLCPTCAGARHELKAVKAAIQEFIDHTSAGDD